MTGEGVLLPAAVEHFLDAYHRRSSPFYRAASRQALAGFCRWLEVVGLDLYEVGPEDFARYRHDLLCTNRCRQRRRRPALLAGGHGLSPRRGRRRQRL